MKRILVAVIYLVSLVTASSAQVVGAASTRPAAKFGQTTASSKKVSKQGPDTDLQETLDTQLKAAVKQAEDQQDDTYWVNKGASMVEKECSIRGMNCALEKLFEAEKAANGNVLKAVVCLKDGSECVPALAYGQGAVHYAVQNLLYYRGQLIVETSPQFVELVTNYGLHSEADRQAAKKYFFALMQRAYDDCDKVSANEDTSHWNTRRTNYCAEEIGSMAALAMIAKDDREKKQVASGVYSLMKSEYDAVGGGIIMTGGTVALGVLGTQDAYAKLERFLTDDTIPSTAGNVWEGINSPIKSSTQNSYKSKRKDGRYLNRINEKFLYLDKQEAKKQGFSTTAWQSPAIQYPYANTLEDVGVLLGQQSAENGAAKRLATKIVQQANQYAKNGEQMAADVHYPVVVGIMDGWRQINNSMNIPSKELITLLYKGNWFDINEGTQRRVHRKAYEFGLRRNMVFDPPVKDKQKVQDYMTYAKAETAASVADVVAQFVLLDMVITKLPALAKGIPNAVRFLKQRSTWVGTNNFIRKLPRTSSVQKAKASTQAVAKQPVKATATPKVTTAAKPKVSQQAAKPRPTGQQAGRTTGQATPKQPAKQPTTSQPTPAAENTGTPTRATKPQAQTAEPGTSAVSPTQLQQQVTGPLAERVQEGKSATENIKAGAKYAGNWVQDYFKALARPTNTLQMSLPGLPGPGFMKNWQAVRAERKAAELSKELETAKGVLAQAERDYQAAIAQADKMATDIDNLTTSIPKLEQDIRKTRAHAEFARSARRTQQAQELNVRASAMEKQLAQQRSELSTLEKEIDGVLEKQGTTLQRREQASAQVEKLEAEYRPIQKAEQERLARAEQEARIAKERQLAQEKQAAELTARRTSEQQRAQELAAKEASQRKAAEEKALAKAKELDQARKADIARAEEAAKAEKLTQEGQAAQVTKQEPSTTKNLPAVVQKQPVQLPSVETLTAQNKGNPLGVRITPQSTRTTPNVPAVVVKEEPAIVQVKQAAQAKQVAQEQQAAKLAAERAAAEKAAAKAKQLKEAQKAAELAKQAQTVATPKLSEGAQYLINDGHQLVGQINALEENIYTYGWIWKQDPRLFQSFDELKQSISVLQQMKADGANAAAVERQLASVEEQLKGVWYSLENKIRVVENAPSLSQADTVILDEVKAVQDLCGKLLSSM